MAEHGVHGLVLTGALAWNDWIGSARDRHHAGGVAVGDTARGPREVSVTVLDAAAAGRAASTFSEDTLTIVDDRALMFTTR